MQKKTGSEPQEIDVFLACNRHIIEFGRTVAPHAALKLPRANQVGSKAE